MTDLNNFDIINYSIFFSNQNNIFPIILYVITNYIIPVIKYLYNNSTGIIDYILNRQVKSIYFVGWEYNSMLGPQFDYPMPIIALSKYVQTANKSNVFKFFEYNNNGKYVGYATSRDKQLDKLNYNIMDTKPIWINSNIWIKVDRYIENDGGAKGINRTKILFNICSYTLSCNDLNQFMTDISIDYKENIHRENLNKTFHFLYKGVTEKGELTFSSTILSDFNKNNIINETFDSMTSKHAQTFINDIDRLQNKEYYSKRGLKRKKGYLLHGISGCGKTSSVMAMSNYSKRHIVEIPMSKIKQNSQLENILNLSEINGVSFNKDEIIILFDEIDQIYDKIKDRTLEETDTANIANITVDSELLKKYTSISDEINLCSILSILDGIGNYDGLIIVATTNYINNLDHALIRPGRLTPIYFDYITFNELKEMVEKAYESKLSIEQCTILENVSSMTHANISELLQKYDNELDEFMEYFKFNK